MPKLLLLEWNSIPVIQTGRLLNSILTVIPGFVKTVVHGFGLVSVFSAAS
jgi:hypothetical protein